MQADLNPPWAHMSEGKFFDVATRLFNVNTQVLANVSFML